MDEHRRAQGRRVRLLAGHSGRPGSALPWLGRSPGAPRGGLPPGYWSVRLRRVSRSGVRPRHRRASRTRWSASHRRSAVVQPWILVSCRYDSAGARPASGRRPPSPPDQSRHRTHGRCLDARSSRCRLGNTSRCRLVPRCAFRSETLTLVTIRKARSGVQDRRREEPRLVVLRQGLPPDAPDCGRGPLRHPQGPRDRVQVRLHHGYQVLGAHHSNLLTQEVRHGYFSNNRLNQGELMAREETGSPFQCAAAGLKNAFGLSAPRRSRWNKMASTG